MSPLGSLSFPEGIGIGAIPRLFDPASKSGTSHDINEENANEENAKASGMRPPGEG